ncbi:MAG TPA: hypothetical protein O0X39_03980 [Methanocorpusculum sp.]|nr:hypothetical protein [Methanocorpusculum sp.]
MNKTLLLIKLRLINTFGINEIRYGHDAKKARKKIGELILYVILGAFAAVLFGGVSAGLAAIGQEALVPLFSCVAGSALVLIIDIFYAGAAIFNPKAYEREIVYPVKPSGIVISRLASLYLVNIILMMVIFIPGCIVLGSPALWGLSVFGIFFTPLIPMSVSLAVGALVSAAASHVKHKSAVSTAISIAFTMALFCFIFLRKSDTPLPDYMADVFASLSAQISMWYPPAAWFGSGDALFTALFAVVSLGVFALFLAIASWKFAPICSAMNTYYAKKTYHMQNLSSSSQLKALFKMELKRYFASSTYVTNTIMGYILAVVLALIICIMGPERIVELTGSEFLLKGGVLLLAVFGILSPVSASSISIEGKQWWIKQTLPVAEKKILQAKLFVSFLVSLPFMLTASVLYCIAAAGSVFEVLAFIAIPFICTVFASVLGLYQNLKHPNFSWDNEVKAVKQGSALTHTMLFGLFTLVLLFVLSMFAGIEICALIGFAVLCAVSIVLYRKCLKCKLNRLEDA